MRIKRKAPRVRFRASSGNVARIALFGSRTTARTQHLVFDCAWDTIATAEDLREANAFMCAAHPDLTGLTSMEIQDAKTRAAFAHSFLYGGGNN